MRKQTLKVAVLGFLGLGFGVFAQTTEETQNTKGKVGINTKEPYATLEIKAKGTADGANGIDGFLPPRLTGAELMNMTKKLKDAGDVKGADYDGLIVYVTEAVQDKDLATLTETDDQWVKYAMHKVSMAGYYRYNYITNTGGLDDATATGLGGSFLHRVGSWVRLEPTGLEVAINPNDPTKVGRRLMGVNTANYGPIGRMAVDMSHQTVASTTTGATGDYSLALGWNSTASGEASVAMGGLIVSNNPTLSVVSGKASWSLYGTTISGEASFGKRGTINANNSAIFGINGTIDANSHNSLLTGQNGNITSSPNSLAWGNAATLSNSSNVFAGGSSVNLTNSKNGIILGGNNTIKGEGDNVLVFGSSTVQAYGNNSVAIGQYATVGTSAAPKNNSMNITLGTVSGGNYRTVVQSDNSIALGNNTTNIRTNADDSIALNGAVKAGHKNSIIIGNGKKTGAVFTSKANEIVINPTSEKVKLAPLTAEDEVEVNGAKYNVAVGEKCYKTGGTATLDLRGKLAYKADVGLLGCVSTTWVKLGN